MKKGATIAEVQSQIGEITNPADCRSWYRLLGEEFGDWDVTCGHYWRTDPDGMLVLVRDDTMQEVRAYPQCPGNLASGWRWVVEPDEVDQEPFP